MITLINYEVMINAKTVKLKTHRHVSNSPGTNITRKIENTHICKMSLIG